MARLWDIKSGELLGSFKGHLCSLKSVAFSPEEKGNLSSKDSMCFKGNRIHCLQDRRKCSIISISPLVSSYLYLWKTLPGKSHYWSSVFCLTAVFCTGARDGNIMIWDTRCSKKGIHLILNYSQIGGIFMSWEPQFLHSDEFQTFVTVLHFLIDGYYRQVKQISGAHNKAETNPSAKVKKRRSVVRGMAPSVVSFFNDWLFFQQYYNVEEAYF